MMFHPFQDPGAPFRLLLFLFFEGGTILYISPAEFPEEGKEGPGGKPVIVPVFSHRPVKHSKGYFGLCEIGQDRIVHNRIVQGCRVHQNDFRVGFLVVKSVAEDNLFGEPGPTDGRGQLPVFRASLPDVKQGPDGNDFRQIVTVRLGYLFHNNLSCLESSS